MPLYVMLTWDADSPFAMLREGAAKPLAEYIDDEEKVRETLTAVRDGYCAELETENQLNAALEAEENGEVPNPLAPPPNDLALLCTV